MLPYIVNFVIKGVSSTGSSPGLFGVLSWHMIVMRICVYKCEWALVHMEVFFLVDGFVNVCVKYFGYVGKYSLRLRMAAE